MALQATISADADGIALDKLNDLIKLRAKYMKNELTADAVTATALNVATSIKAAANVAPWKDNAKLPESSYQITATNLYGGFCAGHKICCRVGSNRGAMSPIKPYIAIAPSNHAVLKSRVYEVTSTNAHDTFTHNRNAPHKSWFILAESEGAVRNLINNSRDKFIRRIFRKEGGLLRYSITRAQTKIYSKGDKADPKIGRLTPKLNALGDDVAIINKGGSDGQFSVEFTNKLNYSVGGLKGGETAVTVALMKAANKTAGMLNKRFAGYKFKDPIPTPFPEIAGRSSK